MSQISTEPVNGTRDFYPEDMRVRQWLFGHFRAVASSFGYEEYDACVLEHAELYIRKAGDEITSQLYEFRDKGDRHLALRPELTPSLARMVLAKGKSLALPARWWSIPQCFRYERAQRGRKREHFQWNMDIVGLPHVAAEVELMSAQAALLERVGLKPGTDVAFRISHRQVLQHHLAGLGIVDEAFAAVCVVVDKRDKIGREATREELLKLGVAAAAAEAVLDLLEVRGLDELRRVVAPDNAGLAALAELLTLAEAAGIAHAITVDCSVVRGLSYYTGTVWELFAVTGELRRAIAGGGRYDRLIETFGGEATPMVGFGFGDVVITDILHERGLIPPLLSGVSDIVYPMDAERFPHALRLASRLRGEGRSVQVELTGRRFKHVIGRAEELGAQRLWIIGGDEARRGIVKVRHLGAERREEELPL
jgi:histidyl-tRNA synthetase